MTFDVLAIRFPLPDGGIQRDLVPSVTLYTANYCSVELGNMKTGSSR